ncbi:SLATT domain-containing protein [Providencia rettgeri]
MSELANKIWWTKKTRIKTEKRLLNLNFYSQFLVLWYSVFLAGYSVYSLVSPPDGPKESAIMTTLSISVMVITIFISSMNFKGRSLLVKECYEQLGLMYVKAKNKMNDDIILESEYKDILSMSENHVEKDFCCAVVEEYYSTKNKSLLSKHPTCQQYIYYWLYKIKNLIVIMFLFFLPVGIVMLLKGCSM